jgi:uncharacterized Zn finger protein (UPF0148 family)
MSNDKSADGEKIRKDSSSSSRNIKSAADLLLKGGTLLSDSCAKCGGVQVRYKEETLCVSCGRKIKESTNNDVMTQQIEYKEENLQEQQNSIQGSNLSNKKEYKGPTFFDSRIPYTISTKIITDKINFLITNLEKENDILIQNTKLDLISKYLEILDKLKIISRSRET